MQLVNLFIKAVEVYGSDRVGMVTYTRAAAAEVKSRVAAHFGVDASAFPWVSTIHAACYKLLGSPSLVDGRRGKFKQFCQSLNLAVPPEVKDTANDVSPYWYSEHVNTDEISQFRAIFAQAAHEMAPPKRGEMTRARYDYLALRYRQWKESERILDFEDLLIEGAKHELPVRVLLLDEAQDSSALMWHVVESWKRSAVFFAASADPWQSIFSYIGADPGLFTRHVNDAPGSLVALGDSHRLTPLSAQYAQNILTAGGWNDTDSKLLATWDGVGRSDREDSGSTFYLARTHRLLVPVQERLEEMGVPYSNLKGYSPLTTIAGKTYRALMTLREGGTVSLQELQSISKTCNRPLPGIQSVEYPELLDAEAVVRILGKDISAMAASVPHAYYLRAVYQQHGLHGLIAPPKVMVGSIHAAKGREADTTYLITSWGTLPARALRGDGRRAEACVAYVAASRHRQALHLIEGARGERYPFGAAPVHTPRT